MTSTESQPVRATIAQLDPALGDVNANQVAVESALSRAKADGSDVVVFPELFLTGYHVDEDPTELAREASRALEEIKGKTQDIVCVIGTPVLDEGRLYNSAAVLEDGEIRGTYHKTHLYGVEHDVFTAGDRFPTFETAVGTVGIEICYDLEFPEVARHLALNGAELLITISANMRPHLHDQELYHGTRAIENGVPHVLCNRVGEERGVDFFGGSGIVDRRGQRILSIGADGEETTGASIDTEPDRTHLHDYLGQRRPEIYDL